MHYTDIKETDQGYELSIDLPGVKEENLSAEWKDGYLCVSATVDHDSSSSKNKRSAIPISNRDGAAFFSISV